jgi:hypothetical protein
VIRNGILTKENVLKSGWKKVELCKFCETQEHLFFSCQLAKYIWSVISVALKNNSIPSGLGDLYRNWFDTSAHRERKAIIIGSTAIIRAIWKQEPCFGRIRHGDPTNVMLFCMPFH